jgi:hypothetical protein
MVPSIFYNPNDDADAQVGRASDGSLSIASPRMQRARSCITVAMLLRSTANTERVRLRRMKAHIMGLRLPVSRLANLWSQAREEVYLYAEPDNAPLAARAPVGSNPEWAAAAWLVMRAALSLLVNVPLADERDARSYVDIVTASGHVLPKRQQRRAIGLARRYVASAIKGVPFSTTEARP